MKNKQNIVVLTGAGISAESGIRTFRSEDGLWEEHRIEDVATPEGYFRNPELVHRFYNDRRRQLLSGNVEPNAAHLALAELEEKHSGDVLVVTQNIDNLHERAGSRNLIHMHGELLKMRCENSHKTLPFAENSTAKTLCSCCKPSAPIRPHIVWFGEMPLDMDRIYKALSRCSLFISIGTSGNVYPAAGFVQEARSAGAHTVELNLEPSIVNNAFEQHHYGPATEVVPEFVQGLLDKTPPS